MVVICVYCGKLQTEGVSFYKFPKCVEIRKLWLKNMGVDENFNVKPNSRLCSDHFDDTCFTKETNQVKKIHSNSVPSRFDATSLKCVSCENIKRLGSNIHFRSFPLKNYQLRNRWIESFGLKDFQPNEKSLICDAHFEEHCFYKRKRGGFYLKANAYPTLFSSHLSNAEEGDTASTSIESHSENDVAVRRTSQLQEAEKLDIEGTLMEVNSENDAEVTRALINKHSCALENVQNPKRFKADHQLATESTFIPNKEKIPDRSATPQEKRSRFHDHHYHSSTRGLKKRYIGMRQRLHRSMTKTKIQKQVIKRLRGKVSSLTDILFQIAPNVKLIIEED